MRTLFAILAFALSSSASFAQPAKTPEHLLPADGAAFIRYDGYLPHKKAYDQTALAQAMKEGLNDFFDHLWIQAWAAAEAEPPMPGGKVATKRRQTAERFADAIWTRGFAVSLELDREKRDEIEQQIGQLTIVLPQGADAKNRETIDAFLRLIAEYLNADISKFKHAGRAGLSFKYQDTPVTWWPEGEHVVLTSGKLPAAKIIDVADGRRANVAGASWHKDLLVAPAYETDIRGFVNIEKLQGQLTGLGRDALKLTNIADRFVEHLVVRHLGLTSLRNITFHLGFDGKYQRSTVRLGIVEPEKRLGLANLITGPVAFDTAKLPPLPPDADYVSARHVDWERIYDFVKGTYTAWLLSELFAGRLPDQKVPDLDRLLGIDFRKDFLQQLDTTIVTWGAHSEGPFFLGQAVAMKVKDSVKVRKGLDAIVKVLGEEKMFAADKTTYRGVEMYVFRKMPLPVTIALHKDWLVLALAPQPVQGCIMRGNGKYRTWQAPSELAAVLAKEAKRAGKSKLLAVSVSDPRPVIEMGLAVLPIYSNFANFGNKKLFDVEKIPNAQSINEWLFPNVGLFYDDGNALRWENHYSINEADDLLLAPYLGVFGGLAFNFGRLFGLAEAEPVMPPLLIDPKKPDECRAMAWENDGNVMITVSVPINVSYTVTRIARGAYVDKEGKTYAESGPNVEFKEGSTATTIVSGSGKSKVVQVSKSIVEVNMRGVVSTRTFKVDGKKVRVTRKDGTVIEPKDLPKLLNEKARVVIVISEEIAADELRKFDDKTLIIRMAR